MASALCWRGDSSSRVPRGASTRSYAESRTGHLARSASDASRTQPTRAHASTPTHHPSSRKPVPTHQPPLPLPSYPIVNLPLHLHQLFTLSPHPQPPKHINKQCVHTRREHNTKLTLPPLVVKAVVAGAAGGIGQPLSLLLKLNPLITELSLYDVVNSPGVAVDLSHINTPAQVKGFLPENNGAEEALKGADIVVIPAGVPRKPGMTRDDLFVNAGICATLAQAIANAAPKAFILVISNPVNSTVPVFAEVLKKAGAYDPRRLFGVTTLDVVRAATFVSSVVGKPLDAPKYNVPVVGGHSGHTILPLLTQSEPQIPAAILGDKEKRDALIKRIQFGGDEVVEAKNGGGSATLSMAQAGAHFANLVIQAAFAGKTTVVQSYIDLEAAPGGKGVQKEIGADLAYFSVNVELGRDGVQNILPIGNIDEQEQALLKAAVAELGPSIEKGVQFTPAPPKL